MEFLLKPELLEWQEEIEKAIYSQPAASGKSFLIAYLFYKDDGARRLVGKKADGAEKELKRHTTPPCFCRGCMNPQPVMICNCCGGVANK